VTLLNQKKHKGPRIDQPLTHAQQPTLQSIPWHLVKENNAFQLHSGVVDTTCVGCVHNFGVPDF